VKVVIDPWYGNNLGMRSFSNKKWM
jgi:hypothetical protein